MSGKLRHHLILQFNIVLWGLTGILGDRIKFDDAPGDEITALRIVFFRTLIAVVFLTGILFFLKKLRATGPKGILICCGVGVIIAVHWFAFFYSIHISTVAIGVVCMSMMAFFTALIEPIVEKRRIARSELLLSIFSILGMTIIFKFEFTYAAGILWGLLCALLAAVFTLFNSKLVKKVHVVSITAFEMLGACFVSYVVLSFFQGSPEIVLDGKSQNWIYLGVLGLVCTAGAFLVGVWIIRHLSPFTVSIGVNLEPVYTILMLIGLDWLTGSAESRMSAGFYGGTAIILSAVIINALIKQNAARSERRKRALEQ